MSISRVWQSIHCSYTCLDRWHNKHYHYVCDHLNLNLESQHRENIYISLLIPTLPMLPQRLPPPSNIHHNISMHIPILQITADIHQENLELLPRPAQDAREGGHAQRRHALGQVLRAQRAQELVLLAARPRVRGHKKSPLLHVLEAHGPHVLGPFV